jgi:inward rectifier potassium channel
MNPTGKPVPRYVNPNVRPRRAVVKGQDSSRWTDVYHVVLTAPWWLFFLGLLALFGSLNLFFASLYVFDPHGISNSRPGSFWDAYLFSVQTIASVNSEMLARSTYVNVVVSFEAFFGILYMATVTGVMFARFSRPYARVLFSKVAVIAPFDGVPTLMFRAANQRGNQIFDASVSVSLARQATTLEGVTMRRFEELKVQRSRSPLFALSWTIMHVIDEKSPLYGATIDQLYDMQFEILILLSGTDDTLADVIYARHSYTPDEILMGHRSWTCSRSRPTAAGRSISTASTIRSLCRLEPRRPPAMEPFKKLTASPPRSP